MVVLNFNLNIKLNYQYLGETFHPKVSESFFYSTFYHRFKKKLSN